MARAYYNEFEPYCVDWLKNLIHEGLIANGDVDSRSIADVQPNDLEGYTQCHFFAGMGGWSYALRLAGWPDDHPVWTGSCPCQPFSQAGKRKGFADDRHLWPVWNGLITERSPAIVFGEQVASASQWLRLVRSDLEALGYAVGAMPIEAASAGADHLRDRYWFVAHSAQQQQHGGRSTGSQGRAELADSSDVGDTESIGRTRGTHNKDEGRGQQPCGHTGTRGSATDNMAHHHHHQGPQGRALYTERADQRSVGPDGMANAYELGGCEEWEQRSGEQCGAGGDQEICTVGYGGGAASERNAGVLSAAETGERGPHWPQHGDRSVGPSDASAPAFDWVIGADGKTRRVKPGVRLLAHGIPARVAKLRAGGNAIDPRPAAAFIQAYREVRGW